MKIEERNDKLSNIKKEINSRLLELDFYNRKELVLWLTKNADYQRLKDTDNQLHAIEFWKNVWLQEIQMPDAFELQGDAFAGVVSLETAEEKYLALQFAIFRIEANMPYEYCVEALVSLEAYKCSSYAFWCIIEKECKKTESVLPQTANLLIEGNELVKGIGLLLLGIRKYSKNVDMILMMANAWLSAKQWEKAYEYLCMIQKPTQEIQELKLELESIVKNETV